MKKAKIEHPRNEKSPVSEGVWTVACSCVTRITSQAPSEEHENHRMQRNFKKEPGACSTKTGSSIQTTKESCPGRENHPAKKKDQTHLQGRAPRIGQEGSSSAHHKTETKEKKQEKGYSKKKEKKSRGRKTSLTA